MKMADSDIEVVLVIVAILAIGLFFGYIYGYGEGHKSSKSTITVNLAACQADRLSPFLNSSDKFTVLVLNRNSSCTFAFNLNATMPGLNANFNGTLVNGWFAGSAANGTFTCR